MSLVNMNCPNCRGKVEVDDSREFATCLYCGTRVFINRNAERQQPPPPARDPYAPSQPTYGTNRPNPYGSAPPYNNAPPQYNAPVNTQMQEKAKRGIITAVIIAIAVAVMIGIFSSIFTNQTESRAMSASEFISAAEKAGYTMIIEEDYDGYGTYWAGAHKFADGVLQKEGNEIYVIDYTDDISEHNAKIEYSNYVSNVTAIGGDSSHGSGSNYQYQINSSSQKFGIAYRIDTINLYVVAPAEYKPEIVNFFDALGFGLDVKG